MKIIDLTHPFTESMPTYPGDSPPSLRQIASVTENGFCDHELKTTLHVGTHVEAPAHMVKGGKRIDELLLESFYGRGVVVDARKRRNLDIEILRNLEMKKDNIVFFCTGLSEKYRTPEYFTDYPVMTEALAHELVKRKVKMVGFDTPSPDLPAPACEYTQTWQAGRTPYAVHKILLRAEILIIENLTNLEALLTINTFTVTAFPIRLVADAAPARVVGIVT